MTFLLPAIVAVLCGAEFHASDAGVVPLGRCLTLGSPGTASLLAAVHGDDDLKRQLAEAQRALGRPPMGEKAAPLGFATCDGLGGLLGRLQRQLDSDASHFEAEPLRAGKPVRLVAFCYATTSYWHLDRIDREGAGFSIRYRLVPKQQRNLPTQIAVILIGPLDPGEYSVSIVREPLDADEPLSPSEAYALEQGMAELAAGSERLDVASDFRFTVVADD